MSPTFPHTSINISLCAWALPNDGSVPGTSDWKWIHTPSRYSGTGVFASRIICSQCGGYYGAKVWHSTSKYRRVIYQCNNKFKGGEKCGMPHIDEEKIKRMFLTAVNELLVERDEIIANLETVNGTLFDNTDLDTEYADLQSEMAVVAEMIQKCVDENFHVAQSQDKYRQHYEGLVNRFETANARITAVDEHRQGNKSRWDTVNAFLGILKTQGSLITEFDEQLWIDLVDSMTVHDRADASVKFRDRTIIKIHCRNSL